MAHDITIDHYEIRGEIGRGSMSVVYLAHDMRAGRDVALKLLPREIMSHADRRLRFEQHVQGLMGLSHTGIAQVVDFGEYAGQPYIVMEYLPGASLATQLELGPLSILEAARFTGQIAPALYEAHYQGIIHRDLRPQNILFDLDGRIALADFGLVAFGRPFGESGDVGLTGVPPYIAPETARPDGFSSLTDVYLLGVLFFHMLTGRPPFEGGAPVEVLRAHLEQPVPNIRVTRPDLPESVQDVIRMALAKNPYDRFSSPLEFQENIAAVLDSIGMSADEEAATSRYVAPVAVEPIAAVVGEYDTVPEWLDVSPVRMERSLADELATQPAPPEFDPLATSPAGPEVPPVPAPAAGEQVLVSIPELPVTTATAPPGEPIPIRSRIRRQFAVQRALGMWRGMAARRAGANELRVRLARFSVPPILAWLLIGLLVAMLIVWLEFVVVPNRAQIVREFCSLAGQPFCERVGMAVTQPQVTPTAAPTLQPVPTAMPTVSPDTFRLAAHSSVVTVLEYDPAGARFASAGVDGRIIIWDQTTGQPLRSLAGHPGEVHEMAFSPDGRLLASVGIGSNLIVWDASTGAAVQTLTHPGERVLNSLAWSPDGTRLASGGDGGVVIIWNLAAAEEDRQEAFFALRHGPVTALAFSSDNRLAAATDDRAGNVNLFVWVPQADPEAQPVPVGRLPALTYRMAFYGSGGALIAATSGGLFVLDSATGAALQTLSTAPTLGYALSPDGTRVVGASLTSEVGIRATDSNSVIRVLVPYEQTLSAGPVERALLTSVAWSPDGQTLLTGWDDGQVIVWDLLQTSYGGAIGPAGPPRPLAEAPISLGTVAQITQWQWLGGHFDVIRGLSFNPAGTQLASGGQDARLTVWDVSTGHALPPFDNPDIPPDAAPEPLDEFNWWVVGVAYHPEGRLLATSGINGQSALVWDAANRRLLTRASAGEEVTSLAWSPDGRRLAVGVISTVTYASDAFCQQNPDCSCDAGDLYCAQPDGVLMLTSPGDVFCAQHPTCACQGTDRICDDGKVLVWDVDAQTGQVGQVTTLMPGLEAHVRAIAFSPDGSQVAAALAGTPGQVAILDVATGSRVGAAITVSGQVHGLAWAPSSLLAVAHSGGLLIWSSEDRAVVDSYQDADTDGYHSAVWLPDTAELLAVGRSNGSVMLLNPQANPVRILDQGVDLGSATALAWSADGRVLAAGASNGVIVLWAIVP